MGQGRKQLFTRLSVALVETLVIMQLSACTVPKIVVLEDALTAEQHNDLGYIYEKRGMNELAEKEYSLAAKKRRGWKAPHFNLGNLAFKSGDYGKAEEYYRKALDIDANDADVMNNLANALLMQGRSRDARLMIERALQTANEKEEYLDTLQKIKERENAAKPPQSMDH